MAFQLSLKPEEIRWPVKVRRADKARPGHYKIETFYATFRILGVEEAQELLTDPNITDAERFRQFMTGWELRGTDDQPLDFNNDETLRAVLNVPYMAPSITQAYRECIGGAPAKN